MASEKTYAVLDENNNVINGFVWGLDCPDDPSIVLEQYPEGCRLLEFGEGITENLIMMHGTYDETLNAFLPIKPDPTYVLDKTTWEWYPDPDLDYNIEGIGDENTLCRYHPDDKCWCIIE
jgi:hypothetical protein